MKSWLRLAALPMLFSITSAATAGTSDAKPGGHLQWQCWSDLGEHVRCMIDAKSSTADFESKAAPAELPFLIQAVWSDRLRKTTIRFTPELPRSDRESLAAFAKTNVCGAYRNCTVAFSPRPPTIKQYIAMVERNDPSVAQQLTVAMRDWRDGPSNTELALATPE